MIVVIYLSTVCKSPDSIIIIVIQSDQNLLGHVSYAVDDAHRPPLHGSVVAAHAVPGTYRHTDGQTQRRFNTPNL